MANPIFVQERYRFWCKHPAQKRVWVSLQGLLGSHTYKCVDLLLWSHALKRWFLILREEMEIDEVASLGALSLHLLK